MRIVAAIYDCRSPESILTTVDTESTESELFPF